MQRYLRRFLPTAIPAAALLFFITLASGADDLLSRAAARFRDKDFTGAAGLARTAEESPQRSFLLGTALLRGGRAEEALPFLAEAETKLPLLADYAALGQAEAMLKLKRYTDAAGRASGLAKAYPGSLLVRKSEKLAADILFEAADYAGAAKAYQGFVEKYPAGSDAVEALFQSGRCREETGDRGGAVQVYRNVWLNNPASPLAKKSLDRIAELEKGGVKGPVYTPEELLRRASTLASQNEFSASLQTLQMIPADGQPPSVAARVDLRSGMNNYRLKNWKRAEKSLQKAAAASGDGIRSEARFWLAKTLERAGQEERACALYLELAGEGRKQEFADDALMEAGGLRRNQGRYADGARLFEQVAKGFPDSRFMPRATWEAGWCRYLAGEHAAAAEWFKALLKDDNQREKAVYWLGRSLERGTPEDAASWYRVLLDEYPAGFYATWYRGRKGLADQREPLGPRNGLQELPVIAGFDKPRLLAALGMVEESRAEMAAARKKAGDRKTLFPGLARVYLELQDYGSAIALFLQNRPVKWDKATLPLWTAGYPLAHAGTVARNAEANGLSEALMFSLIRAESGFSPAVKSPAGAIGLMQLMPATARATAREKGAFDPLRLTEPDYNIRLGTRHFRDLLKGYDGEVIYAIAAYNAGAEAVDRWRRNMKGLQMDEFVEGIPYQETRDYVKKVYAAAATYRQLYGLK